MKRHWLARTSLLAALAFLAACGGGRNPSDAGSYTGAAPSSTAAAAAVTVAQSSQGATLADSDGRTLYAFTKDQGSQSTCYGDCSATWPALTIEGTPAAGEGVDGSLLATTSRKDGAAQVTYKDRPLYYFSGDQQPGDTNGQGIGGVWFTLTPTGELIGATADRAAGDADKGESSYGYP
jgi:predicted lipoprotein with Yx(FWY)xxD motif